jgi:4-hydroxy-4-methyl-2-oxoglutarate aldolase
MDREDFTSTSDVSDACDNLGVVAARSGAFTPAWAGAPPLTGVVHTVRLEPAITAGSPLPELLAFLAGASGGVALVDLDARVDCQCWGEVLATAARHFGVVGALVNGSVRDVEALESLAFPVYARGVYPAAIRTRLRVASVGAPVVVDGETVEEGAFVVADRSGLVAFPAADRERVLAHAVASREAEQVQLEAVRGGADPRRVFVGP